MSYLVLARKHRPVNFDEVIGQEHITEILKKAIKADRVGHSFLFCGPRGIGKTSCARIVAKALNCAKGPTAKPCSQCPACSEITSGNSFDVLEIDGASNRGIDEIRALRENVKFAPGYGRYKIYIVDEVHMLTTEAFNALLKTLEEPPEHVVFIFATTDVNKVPTTIISRCQRFDFKRISVKTIIKVLEDICAKEKFKIENEAVLAIAKAAQGSLRDALSILDQLSAFTDRSIKSEDVFSMLGLVETQLMFDLSDALGQKNCSQALKIFGDIIERGKDIKQLNKDLIEHFRNLMIIKVGGKSLGKLVDYPVAIKEMYLKQTASFTLKEILNAIDAFIQAYEVSRVTESLRMPIEVAFAKLTYQGEKSQPGEELSSEAPHKVEAKSEAKRFSPAEVLKNERGEINYFSEKENPPKGRDLAKRSLAEGQINCSPKDDEPIKEEVEPKEIVVEEKVQGRAEEVSLDVEKVKGAWDALTHAVSRKKISVATYLQEGLPCAVRMNSGKLTLVVGFPPEATFHKESIDTAGNKRLVEQIFSEKLKTRITIEYKIIKEGVNSEEEPVVKAALETFQGKVVSEWHNE